MKILALSYQKSAHFPLERCSYKPNQLRTIKLNLCHFLLSHLIEEMILNILALQVASLHINELGSIPQVKLPDFLYCSGCFLYFYLLFYRSGERIKKVNPSSNGFLNTTYDYEFYFTVSFDFFDFCEPHFFVNTFSNWYLLATFKVSKTPAFQKTITFTEDYSFAVGGKANHFMNNTKILGHIFQSNPSHLQNLWLSSSFTMSDNDNIHPLKKLNFLDCCFTSDLGKDVCKVTKSTSNNAERIGYEEFWCCMSMEKP